VSEFEGTERYEVLGRVGEGGMGTVYAAVDRRRGRKVAVKVLRDPEQGSLFRFKREFRAIADLRHPNLVRLYDLGALPDGAFFFTMELVEGRPLTAWVKERSRAVAATMPLLAETVASGDAAPAEAWTGPGDGGPDGAGLARVLLGVADGLAFLHRAGLVHRDLKPSNVLVDDGGRARLLDFGILAELEGTGGLTGDGAVGTPLYMAPEQVAGEEVTPAVDLYALGGVLYQLLAGRPPFKAPSAGRLLMLHLREPPRPPSEHRPCDADLEALCLDLLAKDPAGRPELGAVRGRLAAVAGDAGEPAAGDRPAAPLGLLGRDAELATLDAAGAALAAPRLVVIAGESGAGKSALADELALRRQADGRAAWFGHCYEREHVPYKAFDAIVDAAVVALALRGDEAFRLLPPGIGALTRLFPVLREVRAVRELPPDTTLRDPRAERERATRALFALLANLSGDEPPLLVIDDLQRADAESVEVLDWLATSPDAPPCLVVATCRGDELERVGVLLARSRVERLDLPPLAEADLARLVDACAARTLAPGERDRLARDAGGNPFLAVELARAADEAAQGELPSVARLVEHRLGRLGEAEGRVLEAAAAAGGPAGFDLLVAVTGLAPSALSDALDELLRAHLLREVPGGREEAWDLAHDRLREAAYERIEPDRRRALHRTLAEGLSADDDAARAVVHWHLAEESRRAREAALAAARAAEAQLAFDRAAELYRLAASQSGGAWQLDAARGEALAKAARHRDAASAFDEAAAAAPASDARDLRLRAASARLAAGDLQAGLDGLERLLETTGDRLGARRTRCYLSILWRGLVFAVLMVVLRLRERLTGYRRPEADPETAFRLRLYDAARHLLAVPHPVLAADFGTRHCTVAERYADPAPRGRARVGDAFLILGVFGPLGARKALHYVEEGEALCAEAGDRAGLLHGRVVRAYHQLLTCNWEALRRTAAEGDALARRHGLFGEPSLMVLHNLRIGAELFSGRLPAVVEQASAYVVEARARGNMGELAQTSAMLGTALCIQGRLDEAERALGDALAITPAEPLSLVRVQVETVAAQLELARGRPEVALERLDDLRRRWRASGLITSSMETLTYRVIRARARVALGWGGPLATLGLGLSLGLSPGPKALRIEALRLKASVLNQIGCPRAALGHVQRSVYLAERTNNRLGLGLSLAARATLRARLERPGTALDRERARAVLAEVGAGDTWFLALEGWDRP